MSWGISPPVSAEDSDTPQSAGNTFVTTPTDTTSDNRRDDSGFTQPARGMTPKLQQCRSNWTVLRLVASAS